MWESTASSSAASSAVITSPGNRRHRRRCCCSLRSVRRTVSIMRRLSLLAACHIVSRSSNTALHHQTTTTLYPTTPLYCLHDARWLHPPHKSHWFELLALTDIIPRSHSYCLSLSLCLEWYNGSITPLVHSGMTSVRLRPPTTVGISVLNHCLEWD